MKERSYISAFLDVINCNKISIIYWTERETMAQRTSVFHGTNPYVKYVFNILYSMRIDVTTITLQITSVYPDDAGRACLRNVHLPTYLQNHTASQPRRP